MADTPEIRMAPIAVLPVFFKLRGKRVLLAGGTAPAVWKAELLSAAGAEVMVVADEPSPDLVALASAPPAGPITLYRRAWEPSDLEGVAMALGAIEDDTEAATFQAAARQAGVPVNVIDKPAFCDFQFGTIVGRSPLVIGISTDGAAPVFGQAIRARIEALLPQSLSAWAEAARDWRPAVQARGLGFRARRRFWEAFAARALETPDGTPTEADRHACEAAALAGGAADAGKVTLVCAGPGHPDGITLEAIKALQDADQVFYAETLHPALVGFARREAVKVALPLEDDEGQTVLDRLEAGAGGRVVWLDTGSPDRCRQWDRRRRRLGETITVEAVPGLGTCAACDPTCPSWPAPDR